MNQLARALLVSCMIAACGGPREAFPGFEDKVATAEVKGEAEVVIPSSADGEPDETNAAGRAYLAKLTATRDTACACKTEECGTSVRDSWMISGLAADSYTLSTADRAREEKLLQRMFMCAALSAPEKREDIARLNTEMKAKREQVLALIADTYDGESDATRTAIRAMKKALGELCACTTMPCIERLQPQLTQLPVVTSKREVRLATALLAGVMTCGTYMVTNDLAIVD